jgi:hypothetical protein
MSITIGCHSQVSLTGFTESLSNSDSPTIISLPEVNILNQFNSSGAFISLKHENGRELDLFVPAESRKEINLSKIINAVESENDPNKWDFFYAPLGGIVIDSVLVNEALESYDSYVTIIEQNELYKLKKVKKNGYLVMMQFVDAPVSFCIAQVNVDQINSYNSIKKLQDGPYHNESELASYVFSNEVKKIRFLLPVTQFCGN